MAQTVGAQTVGVLCLHCGSRRQRQMCIRDRMGPPSSGFPFQAHPSVPFVLAFPVPETDVPETDVAETDDPQTDGAETDDPETDDPETEVPETEVPEKDGAYGWRRDGRCALSTLCMVLEAVTVRFA